MSVSAWLLGQAGEGRVAMTGWIGERPDDGADLLFLLVHPAGHGVADKMRTLATAWGLSPADAGAPVQVPPDTAWLTLGDSDDGPAVWLHHGDRAWLHRPLPEQHREVLAARGEAVLIVGTDGLTMTDQRALDRYLARLHRVWMGRLRHVPT